VNTLWWLTYRHGAAAAGIALIGAPSLIDARMRAVLDGIDEGIEFDEGHALDFLYRLRVIHLLRKMPKPSKSGPIG
jgi:hypothetical protein